MKDKITSLIKNSIEVKNSLLTSDNITLIEKAADKIISVVKKGGKVLIFGNGGSAADSQHMAAELVGRFKKERKAISAIALTTDTSIITALSNDYGYEASFKRQLEAHAKKGDIIVGLSTSGTAKNVIEALKFAKKIGIDAILLTGKDGGEAKDVSDIAVIVKSSDTARIQEAHILIIHILCELIEESIGA